MIFPTHLRPLLPYLKSIFYSLYRMWIFLSETFNKFLSEELDAKAHASKLIQGLAISQQLAKLAEGIHLLDKEIHSQVWHISFIKAYIFLKYYYRASPEYSKYLSSPATISACLMDLFNAWSSAASNCWVFKCYGLLKSEEKDWFVYVFTFWTSQEGGGGGGEVIISILLLSVQRHDSKVYRAYVNSW